MHMGFLDKDRITTLKLSLLTYKWIIIVLSLAIFLRFWNIPELFFFGIDEEYQSLLGWSIVKDFHVIWIGTSMADTGFYLGPGFVYLHSFLLSISEGDPVILGYAGSTIGVLTMLVIFFVTQNLFTPRTAFIATILYGFSNFMNIYDRKFWNPTLVPLISLLMIYVLYKTSVNDRWWVAVAFLLGVIVHIHASLFVYFLIVPIIFLISSRKERLKISISTIAMSIIIFITVYSPLIVYDIAKNFDNLKTPLRLLTRQSGEVSTIEWGFIIEIISRSFFSQSNFLLTMGIVILTLCILVQIWQQRSHYKYRLLGLVGITYIIMFLLYPGKILEYYLLGCIPVLFILTSVILARIPRITLTILLTIYIFVNITAFIRTDSTSGLATKKTFVKKVSTEIGTQKYELVTPEPYLRNGSWRYLFQAYSKTPIRSTADGMFGWIYQDEILNNQTSDMTLYISTNESKPQEYDIKITEGPFNAYIINK